MSSLSKGVLNLKFMQKAATSAGKPLPTPEARKELPAEASSRWSVPVSQIPKPSVGKGNQDVKVVYESSYRAFLEEEDREEEDRGEGSSSGRMKFGPRGVPVKPKAEVKPAVQSPGLASEVSSYQAKPSPSTSSRSTAQPSASKLPVDRKGFAPPANLSDMPASSSSKKRKNKRQSQLDADQDVLEDGARAKKAKKKPRTEKSGVRSTAGERGSGEEEADVDAFLAEIKQELMAG